MSDQLAFNYRFCLEWAAQRTGRVLDFGCGAGGTVRQGLAQGLDIYGADVFFDASPEYEEQAGDLMGGRIRKIVDGKLPFPDQYFSGIVSNQVFEHVEDLPAVAAELRRVLAPGGKVLALFPTKEVWREGHCGVLFAHRLTGSSVFKSWMKLNRALRLSYPNRRSPDEWSEHMREYLTRYCHYRTRREVQRIFSDAGLPVRFAEQDYVRRRWNWPALGARVYRVAAGVVIEAG